MSSSVRIRNWCFTAFKVPEIEDYDDIQYFIYQPELCPKTGKQHYQGYIEMNKKITMKGVKKLFGDNSLHVEPRKGSQEQAINYCKKLETANGDCVEYGTPKRQGSRTDLDVMVEMSEANNSVRTIVHTLGGNALRHINHLYALQKTLHDPCTTEKALQIMDGSRTVPTYNFEKGSKALTF